ncbi:MAG: FadR family transcriptional regulator [Proteobacteria bacterium]|nr:FadR family transcriptional regulator [Burkholderiales bacterium]
MSGASSIAYSYASDHINQSSTISVLVRSELTNSRCRLPQPTLGKRTGFLVRCTNRPSPAALDLNQSPNWFRLRSDMASRIRSRDSTRDLRAFVLSHAGDGATTGDRLPTERAFAERFGLPRNAVRRTLADLEAEGRIRREVGRGTFVAAPSQATAQAATARRASPAELMEARLRIEPAAVELIVVNATPADYDRMDHCLDRSERAVTLDEFESWDAAFHLTLAAAARNELITRIYELFHEARQHADFGKLRDRIVTETLRIEYQKQHRAIVEALKKRDATAARQAVVIHLTYAHRNLFHG